MVVDDGSLDGTADAARQAGADLVLAYGESGQGRGGAHRGVGRHRRHDRAHDADLRTSPANWTGGSRSSNRGSMWSSGAASTT